MPIAVAVSVEVRSRALAIPKSMTRGPSGASSTLDGLKSRCTMSAWWIATSAVTVPIASRCSAEPVRGPSLCTTESSVGPSMYSLTMNGRCSSTPVSSTAAVQNAETRRVVLTSRMKRSKASASCARSARSNLTATRVPDEDSPR